MPNHLHFIIYLAKNSSNLNKIISNLKRFWAYEIVARLKRQNELSLLEILKSGVRPSERKNNKQHQVFRLSFDAKVCFNIKMLQQKMEYNHLNPVSGNWNLVEDYIDYKYSSAGYYDAEGEKPDFLRDFRDFA